MRSSQGFTLLELVVVMAILSIIGVIVFGSFAGVLASGQRAGYRAEQSHIARFIIRKLTEDLASASIYTYNEKGRFIGIEFKDDERNKDEIRFSGYGRRFVLAGSGSDQAEITWFIKKDDGERPPYTLMRRENPDVYDPLDDSRNVWELDVTDRLVSFKARYRDRQKWNDSFDSTLTRRLPEAVEVEFTLIDDDGYELTRKALIPVGGRS